VRKHCPATSFRLGGWKANQPQEERERHLAVVRSTPEDTGQLSLPCPPVNYTGEMIVSCEADAELWTVQKRCVLVAPQTE
jgi:hypothetical protein